MTLEEIRKDLQEIKCFYALQESFIKGTSIVRNQPITQKVNKYNAAISQAPPKMYVIYMELYVSNKSQFALAKDWKCSEANIRYYNRKLFDFFMSYFNK